MEITWLDQSCFRIETRDRFTMGARAAAFAYKKFFKFKTILPCHYGTFPGMLDPDASKLKVEMAGHNVVAPTIGEPVTV
jgi:L-ascorbate metabolism protein UlaG (beta-lactamase superfamily)